MCLLAVEGDVPGPLIPRGLEGRLVEAIHEKSLGIGYVEGVGVGGGCRGGTPLHKEKDDF